MSYTEITQKSFESVLSEFGKYEQIKDPVAKENIYLLDDNIKIYSSIVDGFSRNVGDDAIRVLIWDSIANLPVKSSEARVYRIDTWVKNLRERILKVKADIQTMKRCKTCGAFCVERINSKTNEKFWGCLNYKNHDKNENSKVINSSKTYNKLSPLLTETQHTTKIPSVARIEERDDSGNPVSIIKKEFEPNKYQKNIFKFIREGTGHCVIKAGAGCTKTTSIVMGTNYIPQGYSVLYLAYNVHIKKEIERRVSKSIQRNGD